MDARQGTLARVLLGAALLWLLTGPAEAQPVPAGRVLPLTVRDGRCECVLPTSHPDEKYYLILGSLARQAGPFRVTVRTQAAAEPVAVPLDDSAPDPAWTRHVQTLRTRLDRARQHSEPGNDYPPAAAPPRRRLFHL